MSACNCGENGKCSLEDGQKSCECDGGYSEDTDGQCKSKQEKISILLERNISFSLSVKIYRDYYNCFY